MSGRKIISHSKKKRRVADPTYLEPPRKSLYDVLINNMQVAGRVTFVHRIIYIGEHTFPIGDGNISAKFRDNINYINSLYCEEYLTGFLLYYTTYFCHVIEGSEEGIQRHLNLLLNSNETASHLGKLKVLVVYHHINRRFMKMWTELAAKPPNLLEKIEQTDIATTMSHVILCIQKLYKLGIVLKPVEFHEKSKESSEEEEEDVPPPRESKFSNCRRSLMVVRSTVSNFDVIGRPSNTLPEIQLLEFLLDSEHIQDLQDYEKSYGFVPIYLTYLEKAWPVSCDYVPKNIFDDEIDPVIDLPSQVSESL